MSVYVCVRAFVCMFMCVYKRACMHLVRVIEEHVEAKDFKTRFSGHAETGHGAHDVGLGHDDRLDYHLLYAFPHRLIIYAIFLRG